MTNTAKHVSEDNYALTIILIERRADLINRKALDKAKLAKAGASLNAKIQSERYFNTQIATVNAELDAIPALEA